MNFSKRDALEPYWTSPFAPASKISEIADSVSADLKSWDYLKGLKQDEFTAKLTTVYVKINYMHPFPEGNGRSTQTLLSQLAREAGYDLNFANVDRKDWNHAAGRSMPQRNVKEPSHWRKPDTAPIHEAFKRIVEPLRERQKTTNLER
jgi:fido (protein-threonine AMPylation protein)